ncbi:MAG: RtcB family protein [Acidobacteriota bacterium]
MSERVPLEKLSEFKYRIPASFKPFMRAPAIVYANEVLMEKIREDQSLMQAANSASLPGIVGNAIAMPDMHFGYGLPIGGVVATDWDSGVVSPGGVGFDINCGVRLCRSALRRAEIEPHKKTLAEALFATVPSGVGSKGSVHLSKNELARVCERGARFAVDRGMGEPDDLTVTEAGGSLPWADPDAPSSRAYDRGKDQLGTLGSGNHFLEVQYVDEIYDEDTASRFGLFKDQVTLMIHSGSRGFGHQVCTDFLGRMSAAMNRYGISVPDRQLACVPISSPEGKEYLGAMAAAANYAWANRQMLMHWAREAFYHALELGPKALDLGLIYDHAHNIVKKEEHVIDGKRMTVAVHRKGATRSFPPGHPDVPAIYRQTGQPTLIPGDMGRCSYVLAGVATSLQESFGTTCHGAGRVMSRAAAVKACRGRAIHRELEDRGILVRSAEIVTVKEEAPEAYKDVSEVVAVCHGAGLSRRVARLRPMVVIKG